jgi:hypothetical protein
MMRMTFTGSLSATLSPMKNNDPSLIEPIAA